MIDDDTRPVLTPTLAKRVREIAATLGVEVAPGSETERALARVIGRHRFEDYAAGREGKQQSQQMAAVRPKG